MVFLCEGFHYSRGSYLFSLFRPQIVKGASRISNHCPPAATVIFAAIGDRILMFVFVFLSTVLLVLSFRP